MSQPFGVELRGYHGYAVSFRKASDVFPRETYAPKKVTQATSPQALATVSPQDVVSLTLRVANLAGDDVKVITIASSASILDVKRIIVSEGGIPISVGKLCLILGDCILQNSLVLSEVGLAAFEYNLQLVMVAHRKFESIGIGGVSLPTVRIMVIDQRPSQFVSLVRKEEMQHALCRACVGYNEFEPLRLTDGVHSLECRVWDDPEQWGNRNLVTGLFKEMDGFIVVASISDEQQYFDACSLLDEIQRERSGRVNDGTTICFAIADNCIGPNRPDLEVKMATICASRNIACCPDMASSSHATEDTLSMLLDKCLDLHEGVVEREDCAGTAIDTKHSRVLHL